jgi:hypothetical protein
MPSVLDETDSGLLKQEEPSPGSSNDGISPLSELLGDDSQSGLEENPTPDTAGSKAAPRPQRHYPPRTCRICLETILPTYEPAPGGIAAMLDPTPTISYISSDPQAGRLIRPCKCSGSSRYVHEGCLQSWRHADRRYQRRNFWECPTCRFRYKLERMRWARWISSPLAQVLLTIAIMFTAIFIFGFVADPIIDVFIGPLDPVTPLPSRRDTPQEMDDIYDTPWAVHFLKGITSMGLIGFIRIFVTSPWHMWNIRHTGALRAGTRRGAVGRDRPENFSWHLILGLVTILIVSGQFS